MAQHEARKIDINSLFIHTLGFQVDLIHREFQNFNKILTMSHGNHTHRVNSLRRVMAKFETPLRNNTDINLD
jgi:hypothetical protein